MAEENYRVEFSDYSRRHFIKKFKKRHSPAVWDRTEVIIVEVCSHIDNMLRYNRADQIVSTDGQKIIKLDFAVDGTRQSPKASGNRCILFVDDKRRTVRVLLVYSKNDIDTGSETEWWKSLIKANFPEESECAGL